MGPGAPGITETKPDTCRIVADIGATNARFAYITPQVRAMQCTRTYRTADYPDLEDVVRAYMEQAGTGVVSSICLAVAAPAENDLVDMPNNHWTFSKSALQQALGASLTVINDFTAQALCLDELAEDELSWIGEARPQGGQIRCVAGPGTGMGTAVITRSGEILPSEGGHVSFAPVDRHEMDLLEALWTRYPRVSIERLLSGQGLENLYWANSRIKGRESELPAAEVTAGARAGDDLCISAIDDFLAILASFAGDLALIAWAADGVYLSGGILPRIMDFFDREKFRARFDDKGRYREYSECFPLALVTAENPGLLGCVAALNRD